MTDRCGRDGGGVTDPRFPLHDAGLFPWDATEDPPLSIAGRYDVEHLIGRGGTARVYRAVDRRLDRAVAVKVYDREAVAVEQVRRVRERTIQAGLDHPRVVAVLDSGTDHGRPFLVMQLVDGENLAERLLSGPVPVEEGTDLAVQLAETVEHLHARRVVHRDLKPANILLGPDGPLISDFGIAHELGSTRITGTGFVTGTAAYLAPEQIVGEPAGPAADIYALGLILLECLTGEREYPGTMAEAAMARLHRPPRVPAGLPAPLAHTLERMTARDPGDRPTAAETLWMLRRPDCAVTPSRPPASATRRRRRNLLALGGFAAATTAAVLAAVLPGPGAADPARGGTPAAQPPAATVPSPSTAVTAKPPASSVAAPQNPAAPPRPVPIAVNGPGVLTAVPGNKARAEGGKARGKPKGKGHGGP
ncbi:protein kinase [Amycolatopsis sp. NPDC051373]|uniref:serine/threonine-protein kinase n=1 Tax=Amycolatopsis sp. NPDC051373 TaxID=3155801 RepID=UPI00344DAEA7